LFAVQFSAGKSTHQRMTDSRYGSSMKGSAAVFVLRSTLLLCSNSVDNNPDTCRSAGYKVKWEVILLHNFANF